MEAGAVCGDRTTVSAEQRAPRSVAGSPKPISCTPKCGSAKSTRNPACGKACRWTRPIGNRRIARLRRGGRAVECTGLENRRGLTALVSSNLTLSAKLLHRWPALMLAPCPAVPIPPGMVVHAVQEPESGGVSGGRLAGLLRRHAGEHHGSGGRLRHLLGRRRLLQVVTGSPDLHSRT